MPDEDFACGPSWSTIWWRMSSEIARLSRVNGNRRLAQVALAGMILYFCSHPLHLTVAAAETNTSTTTNSVPHSESRAPSNPREFFNAGTEKLRTGKLREAEAFLESSLSS